MSEQVEVEHPVADNPENSASPTYTVARGRVWLGFVAFAGLVVSLSQSLLIPVLPSLPNLLHTTADAVQWMLTATLLVGAVAVPFMGRLGDMFGKRRILLVALAALVVGSLVSAMSNDITTQIIGRAIQGLSLAVVPLGISLLGTLLPRERAGAAIALISSMLGVGGALGLPLAGLVAETWDFHALFWITSVAGIIAFVGIITLLPEALNKTGGRVDVLGAILLSATLITLLLPLAQGGDWGWGSLLVIGLFVISAILMVVFGWWQLRTVDPILDLRVLRRRPVILTNIASLFLGFALFASLIGTVSYVQAPPESGYGFGLSVVASGLVMLPSGLSMVVLSPIAARMIRAIGGHYTLAIGAAVIMIGWLMRIFLTGSLWEVVLGATVAGIGTGIGYSSMPSLVNAHSPRNELAAANGFNSLVRSLGSSLASAIGGTILAASTIAFGPLILPSLGAYQLLFAMCAGAAVLSIVFALLIPGRRKNRT